MLEGLNGPLRRRAHQLGLHRADDLARIQKYLDAKYPGKCRAVSLNGGVLKITTPSASVSSELHWSQAALIRQFRSVTKVHIKIN